MAFFDRLSLMHSLLHSVIGHGLNTGISQDSAAMHLRCSGMFNDIIANFVSSLSAKES